MVERFVVASASPPLPPNPPPSSLVQLTDPLSFFLDLYLLPFGPLRSSFTAKELEEVADLMADRKIRVRVGMESFLEGWGGDGESSEEEEIGEDEKILIQAQEERRLLMPY